MTMRDTILVRDPDAKRREETGAALGDRFNCEFVETIQEARDILERDSIQALVVRERPGDSDGLPFCRAVHQHHPEIKILLVALDIRGGCVIDAFNEGCLFRCLAEPVSPEMLARAVRDASRRFEMDRVQTLLVERAAEIDRQINSLPYWLYRLRSSLFAFAGMIAGSVGLCVLAAMLLLLAGMGVFLLLYYLKSALGFDFFGDRHLKDFF